MNKFFDICSLELLFPVLVFLLCSVWAFDCMHITFSIILLLSISHCCFPLVANNLKHSCCPTVKVLASSDSVLGYNSLPIFHNKRSISAIPETTETVLKSKVVSKFYFGFFLYLHFPIFFVNILWVINQLLKFSFSLLINRQTFVSLSFGHMVMLNRRHVPTAALLLSKKLQFIYIFLQVIKDLRNFNANL